MDQRNLMFSALLAVLAVFLITVSTADAISCYQCNSGKAYQGDACKDLKGDTFKKPCEQTAQEEWDLYQLNRTYVMCRTYYQDVEGDSRVVRSCATRGQPSRGCIDRTGTKGVKLRYCECEGDNCNKSSVLTAAVLVTSLAAIFALVLGRH